jgi:antitoxin (DNA-binding transcriptional repressor) of toxin-antitoxin stability system
MTQNGPDSPCGSKGGLLRPWTLPARAEWGIVLPVSETVIPVAEAARDFLRLLEWVETRREPATLVRDGQPVARIVPLPRPAATCDELAERWDTIPSLPPEEGESFATDLEQARANLPSLKAAWD